LQISEDGALARRLERLRDEVHLVSRREREAQEEYRSVKEELRQVQERIAASANGIHGHA
jgi:pre-mRNA-splicing factor CDC5/CEF1